MICFGAFFYLPFQGILTETPVIFASRIRWSKMLQVVLLGVFDLQNCYQKSQVHLGVLGYAVHFPRATTKINWVVTDAPPNAGGK